MAVLTAVVVLPSLGKLDVTNNDFGARPAVERRTEVRRWRYDSASGDWPSTFISNSGLSACPLRFCNAPGAASVRRRPLLPIVGITASAGRFRKRSTSSVE